MAKISSIDIKAFRGIPLKCQLDFTEKNSPRSLILYGGNGSGKSSIVDALEFVLQGRIDRSISIKSPKRPSVFNLLHSDFVSPLVSVTFNDDTTFKRTVDIERREKEGGLGETEG